MLTPLLFLLATLLLFGASIPLIAVGFDDTSQRARWWMLRSGCVAATLTVVVCAIIGARGEEIDMLKCFVVFAAYVAHYSLKQAGMLRSPTLLLV